MAKLKLGVDVGGTFTDVVGINEDGKVYFAKTPSTPEDQSIGVLNGIRALLEELGVAPDCVTGVAHGTYLPELPYLQWLFWKRLWRRFTRRLTW